MKPPTAHLLPTPDQGGVLCDAPALVGAGHGLVLPHGTAYRQATLSQCRHFPCQSWWQQGPERRSGWMVVVGLAPPGCSGGGGGGVRRRPLLGSGLWWDDACGQGGEGLVLGGSLFLVTPSPPPWGNITLRQ